jgi:cyd operon protein YbgE
MTMNITADMSEIEPRSGDSSGLIPYPNPAWSRLASLLLASVLSVMVLAYPRAVAASLSEVNHALLSLVMWGIATGFIHGVGFVPRMIIWRIIFNPFIGWPLMLTGVLSMIPTV